MEEDSADAMGNPKIFEFSLLEAKAAVLRLPATTLDTEEGTL
jgi:hypothetical protein